jgi:3-oxoacyl-[acyl-carrier protein] reductase
VKTRIATRSRWLGSYNGDRKVAGLEVLAKVVAVLVTREPDLYAIDRMDAWVSPLNAPVSLVSASGSRTALKTRFEWLWIRTDHASSVGRTTLTMLPGRSTTAPRVPPWALAATTATYGKTIAPMRGTTSHQPWRKKHAITHTMRIAIAMAYLIMRLFRSSFGDGGSEVMDAVSFMVPSSLRLFSTVSLTVVSTQRTVLITGGNRGIGFAIAEEFIAQGHRVAVTARSGEGPAGSLTVKADVTDYASIDAALAIVEAELGPIEVVVANAGITRDTLLLRMTEDDFTSVVDTNLSGAFRVVKRASKGMLKARFGRIILVSSVVGLYGSAGQVNYSASKSGLVGLARSVTRELGARGITANVVAPGFIETDMTAELSETQQADYKKAIPAGRFASAREVARVITWLAGDDAAYISGAVIPVDGGLGMGH